MRYACGFRLKENIEIGAMQRISSFNHTYLRSLAGRLARCMGVNMKKAVYPGSFDPVTNGHLDIILRSSALFDELIVGVLKNNKKTPLFSVEERVKILFEIVKDYPNIRVESFEGLTVNFAKKCGAKVIVRGLRAITDFEYELQLAQTNRILDSKLDTMFLTTSLEYAYLSSTTVKEVAEFGGDISEFVPKIVVDEIYNKKWSMEYKE